MRRLTVGRLMEGHGLSQRRACGLAGIGHSTLSYQRRRASDEAARKRLRELAAQRRRFGYRRLGWLLAREGQVMNHKKVYRLYREERLMVRRRGGRKRALGSRTPMSRCADAVANVARSVAFSWRLYCSPPEESLRSVCRRGFAPTAA